MLTSYNRWVVGVFGVPVFLVVVGFYAFVILLLLVNHMRLFYIRLAVYKID